MRHILHRELARLRQAYAPDAAFIDGPAERATLELVCARDGSDTVVTESLGDMTTRSFAMFARIRFCSRRSHGPHG